MSEQSLGLYGPFGATIVATDLAAQTDAAIDARNGTAPKSAPRAWPVAKVFATIRRSAIRAGAIRSRGATAR